MMRKRTPRRPAKPETPAAFTRFQKLTRALLGIDKEEYDQKRAEYDRRSSVTNDCAERTDIGGTE
jgi:hypothetical protein